MQHWSVANQARRLVRVHRCCVTTDSDLFRKPDPYQTMSAVGYQLGSSNDTRPSDDTGQTLSLYRRGDRSASTFEPHDRCYYFSHAPSSQTFIAGHSSPKCRYCIYLDDPEVLTTITQSTATAQVNHRPLTPFRGFRIYKCNRFMSMAIQR